MLWHLEKCDIFDLGNMSRIIVKNEKFSIAIVHRIFYTKKVLLKDRSATVETATVSPEI